MSKIANPNSKVWDWPTTFYNSYFPRLKSMGFITDHEEKQAYRDIKQQQSFLMQQYVVL